MGRSAHTWQARWAARPLLSGFGPGLRSVYCSAAEAKTPTSVRTHGP
jgi:hypothetical protein